MKIICTKEEFAEIISICAQNRHTSTGCNYCPLYNVCQGAYVDTLTSLIEIVNNGGENK